MSDLKEKTVEVLITKTVDVLSEITKPIKKTLGHTPPFKLGEIGGDKVSEVIDKLVDKIFD